MRYQSWSPLVLTNPRTDVSPGSVEVVETVPGMESVVGDSELLPGSLGADAAAVSFTPGTACPTPDAIPSAQPSPPGCFPAKVQRIHMLSRASP
jgi:hypothetical protein